MPETSRENNERPLSGCREATRTAKSASCRWRTMRRPRNPLPPNTVTRRQDMSQKYRAALGYAILFSALPEAKQASAQARRIRRVTSSDEFQAGARPSFASGTEGSKPAPSSGESCANLIFGRTPSMTVAFRRHRRVVGGTGAARPLRDGSPVSRPPERHRLAAQFGGGHGVTNTSGALCRIAGAPSSARRRGTLSAPTSGCSDKRRRPHSDKGVNIQHLAQLRILANRRVALGLDECFILELPRRPQHPRLARSGR